MERATKETWAKRVEQWKDSGLTAAQFAKEIGISHHSLAWWKWRLGKKNGGRRSRSARATQAIERVSPLAFVEMTAPRGEPLEVVLINGMRVRVPVDFDAVALGRLLDVLVQRR